MLIRNNTTNFTGNLHQAGETAMYFIIEEAKETVLDFSRATMKPLYFCFVFDTI